MSLLHSSSFRISIFVKRQRLDRFLVIRSRVLPFGREGKGQQPIFPLFERTKQNKHSTYTCGKFQVVTVGSPFGTHKKSYPMMLFPETDYSVPALLLLLLSDVVRQNTYTGAHNNSSIVFIALCPSNTDDACINIIPHASIIMFFFRTKSPNK